MTDSEIVTALTACHKGNGEAECEKCPYVGKRGCMDILGEDALALINRQQAEIERLTAIVETAIESTELSADFFGKKAVREFAEKLKEYCNEIANQEWNKRTLPVSWADAYKDFIDDIDRLLEETGCNDG